MENNTNHSIIYQDSRNDISYPRQWGVVGLVQQDSSYRPNQGSIVLIIQLNNASYYSSEHATQSLIPRKHWVPQQAKLGIQYLASLYTTSAHLLYKSSEYTSLPYSKSVYLLRYILCPLCRRKEGGQCSQSSIVGNALD